MVSTAVRVGYFPDSYGLDAAYIDGRRIGTVEKFVMDDPDPDRLGPCIRRALREGFSVELQEVGEGSSEVAEC